MHSLRESQSVKKKELKTKENISSKSLEMKVVAALIYLVLVAEAIPQKMALANILVRVFARRLVQVSIKKVKNNIEIVVSHQIPNVMLISFVIFKHLK